MNDFNSSARSILFETFSELDRDSIDLSAKKVSMLISNIEKELNKAYKKGQMNTIDILFPEIFDDYFSDSPLREAALKIVFEEQKE